MPRLSLLLLPALSACTTQATTDGTDGQPAEVSQAELDALTSQLAELEQRLEAEEAKSADLEQRLADAEIRLEAVEASTGTGTTGEELEARLSAVETDLSTLEIAFDVLSGRVDEIEGAMGNGVWSIASEGDGTGGKGADFSAIGPGLDISVTHTEPILAWCIVQSYEGTPAIRLTLTSADGSWEESGTEITIEENPGMKIYLSAMASFTPPEAGDYTLDCEGKRGTTWYDFDVVAVQAAPGLDE